MKAILVLLLALGCGPALAGEPVVILPVVDHRPVVTVEIVGNFDELPEYSSVRDLVFSVVTHLRPGLRPDDLSWKQPYREGPDLVYDLLDGRASTSMRSRSLGRYRVNRRTKTFRALLTVYK